MFKAYTFHLSPFTKLFHLKHFLAILKKDTSDFLAFTYNIFNNKYCIVEYIL